MSCPWGTINGRFEAVRELARGETSSVTLSRDRSLSGKLTALKVFRFDDPESWSAARREFETLRRIHHPRIAAVYSLGKVEQVEPAAESGAREPAGAPAAPAPPGPRYPAPGDAYLAFEYIDGLDLRSAFLRLFPAAGAPGRDSGPPAAARWKVFYHAIAQIAQGLEAIHARGLVHHDIKPQNLLLIPEAEAGEADDRTHPPRRFKAWIIDFGFAQEETTPLGRRIRGTIPYIAPEALTGSFADGRSDLYALGISLVHAISGSFPFPVGSPAEWIGAVRGGVELPLEDLLAGTPPELIELIRALTRLNPEERLPGAAALRSRLEMLIGTPLDDDARAAVPRIPTLGWERELGLLRNEIESLKQEEPAHSLILIEADEGSYVDRLIEEIEVLAAVSEACCIRGRAHRPSRHPYHPLHEAFGSLLRQIDLSSSRFRRLRPTLAVLFPDLEDEKLRPDWGRLANPEAQLQLIDSLADFLVEAGKVRPTVVVLEDLQLADSDTRRWIEALAMTLHRRQRGGEEAFIPLETASRTAPDRGPASCRVLLIGVYREAAAVQGEVPVLEDESTAPAADSSGLAGMASLPFCLKLKIKPLDLEQVEEWLSQRHPGLALSARAVRRLHETTGGSPRLLDQVLGHGRLRPPGGAGGQDPLSPLRLEEADGDGVELGFRFAASLGEILGERIERLSAADLEILEVLAVARSPLRLETLIALLDPRGPRAGATASGPERPGEEPAGDRIRRLAGEGLIDLIHAAGGREAGWAHESPRLQVYLQIPEERRRELHRRILDGILAEPGGESSEAAAYHALRGNLDEAAVRCGLAAADRHRRAYSLGTAVRLYEEILGRLSLPGGPGGSGGEAAGAQARPEQEQTRRRILRQLGEIYRQSRNYGHAQEKFTVLLSLEENDTDPVRRSEIYRLMGDVYQENGDPVNAFYFLEKSLQLLEHQPAPRERIESLLSLSSFHFLRGHCDQAEDLAQRALDILGVADDGDLSARICLRLGAIAAKRNDHARSLSYGLRALDAAREAGELARVLEVTEALGATYMARGEYEKAIEHFTRGVELATLLGSKKSLARFYNQIGTIQFNRANHFLALENYQRSLDLWKEIGDQRGIANSYNNIGLALRLKDDLARAAECYRRAIEIFSRIGDEHGQAAGMNNLANILEMEGKYQEALDYAFRSLEKRKKVNSRSGIAFSYYRIGKIYQSKGELDKAFGYAEKGLQIRREISDKMGIAYSKIQLADLLLLKGRLGEALRQCEEGESEFEILDNASGRLVAREIRARLYLQTGDLDRAAATLEEVLAEARQGNQQLLVGTTLLNQGRISMELEDFHEAELRFDRSEATFRENRNRRELAEILLERCRLALDFGHQERALSHLETAYALLEELGVRDLVPLYFLLRGRLEIEGHPADPDRGKKFLERALVEAREASFPEIHWQVHHRLGLQEEERGNIDKARSHFHKAMEILEEQKQGLPEELTAHFLELRERRMLLRSFTLDRGDPPAAVAGGAPPGNSAGGDGAGEGSIQEAEPPAGGAGQSRLRHELRELKSLNRRLLKLQEINQAINSELDLRRLLEKIVDAVLDLMDAERAFLIVTVPGQTAQESIHVARKLNKKTVENPEREVSRSISAEVIRTGKPILATNAIVDDRFSGSKSVQKLELLSVLCVPLRSHDRVLGAIYLDNRQRQRAFQVSDQRILETFANQATTALINARLSDDLQQRNLELTEKNQQLAALSDQLQQRNLELTEANQQLAALSDQLQQRNLELTEANQQLATLSQRLMQQVQEGRSELERAREQVRQHQNKLEAHLRFDNIIGKSEPMQQIFQVLVRVAPTNLPVLIQGESGTGKELIARAIHQKSARGERPFISENCAALSDTLLESELFGHTRGAFTGAVAERKGLFEVASGGTLFLDEVGDMSLAMQKKLLRVLEENELRKVGGKDPVKIDVRIISASNRELRKLVEEGSFREDLYYRLNGVRIELPSLRERREDIHLLVQHFLEEISRESSLPRKVPTPEAMRLLMNHSWPGNVRELKHFLERTALLVEGDSLNAEDCTFDSAGDPLADGKFGLDPLMVNLSHQPLRRAREIFLKHFVERCFLDNNGNVTRAAEACEMSRESFHRFLKKYRIGKGDGRSDNSSKRKGAGRRRRAGE